MVKSGYCSAWGRNAPELNQTYNLDFPDAAANYLISFLVLFSIDLIEDKLGCGLLAPQFWLLTVSNLTEQPVLLTICDKYENTLHEQLRSIKKDYGWDWYFRNVFWAATLMWAPTELIFSDTYYNLHLGSVVFILQTNVWVFDRWGTGKMLHATTWRGSEQNAIDWINL